MPVLTLPVRAGADERKLSQSVSALHRRGVGQILPPEGCGGVETNIPTCGLWRSVCVPLALAALEETGTDPHRAVVGFSAQWVTGELVRSCIQLGRQVRGISLDVPRGGQALAWQLERDYGIPVRSGGGDVNLQLAQELPLSGVTIPLWEEEPHPEGFDLCLNRQVDWQGCAHLPLLAVLLAQGRIGAGEVQVVRAQ